MASSEVSTNKNELSVEVNISPLKSRQFPGPHSRVDRTQKQREEFRKVSLRRIEEYRHLLMGERLNLLVNDRSLFVELSQPAGRIDGNDPVLFRVIQQSCQL